MTEQTIKILMDLVKSDYQMTQCKITQLTNKIEILNNTIKQMMSSDTMTDKQMQSVLDEHRDLYRQRYECELHSDNLHMVYDELKSL